MIVDSKIVVFGGVNFSSYLDPELEIIELDQPMVSELRKQEHLKLTFRSVFQATLLNKFASQKNLDDSFQ